MAATACPIEAVEAELARRGHTITTTSGPIAHPVMIAIDPQSGVIQAAGDLAARRHAAALP